MRYRYSVSYESDTQPVYTVRGELEAASLKSAGIRGARQASAQWPKGRKGFRSMVVVVERLDELAETSDSAA